MRVQSKGRPRLRPLERSILFARNLWGRGPRRGAPWVVALALLVVAGLLVGGWWYGTRLAPLAGALRGDMPGSAAGGSETWGKGLIPGAGPGAASGGTEAPDGGPAGASSQAGSAAAGASEAAPALSPDGPAAWEAPLPGDVLARYGWTYSDALGDWRLHAGWDIAAPPGTPVTAPTLSRVVAVGESQLWGHEVTLDLGGGWTAVYRGLGAVAVTEGDTLEAGDELGTVGGPGGAEAGEAAHLHWEVRKDGAAVDPGTVVGR